jgi:hypothetical protein
MIDRIARGLLFTAFVAAAGCGDPASGDCPDPCGPCEECLYGVCIPVDVCGPSDAEAGADVPADVPADSSPDVPEDSPPDVPADSAEETPDVSPDVPSDVGPDVPSDVGPDVPPDVPPDAWDVLPDVPPDVSPDDAEAEVRPDVTDVWDVPDEWDVEAEVRPDVTDVWDVSDVWDVETDVPLRCGGFFGEACPDGMVCDVRSCDEAATGTCVSRPGPCPLVWAPVCGCDRVTYGNDCERLAAGVALDHLGECGGPPTGVPECVARSSTSWEWVHPVTGEVYCEASCSECRAECRVFGFLGEGWYAVCPGGREGGCLPLLGYIATADCE